MICIVSPSVRLAVNFYYSSSLVRLSRTAQSKASGCSKEKTYGRQVHQHQWPCNWRRPCAGGFIVWFTQLYVSLMQNTSVQESVHIYWGPLCMCKTHLFFTSYRFSALNPKTWWESHLQTVASQTWSLRSAPKWCLYMVSYNKTRWHRHTCQTVSDPQWIWFFLPKRHAVGC